ncbi:hypothetical protein BYT27DRAFT_7167594 [Phlegmacium glaucopus]|nr:hypothetical protein BYT27DRAFT_7167594 [Phlegmacium glaucopus]
MTTMGPPLSPRETRRSGRRSAPSVSTGTSKSPDSDQPPRQKDNSSRVVSSSNGSGARNKRLKQEDCDEPPEDRRNYPASSAASSVSNSTGKAKRKVKDKEKDKPESNTNSGDQDVVSVENQVQDPQEEEEQGITRCVCGSAEDDPDAGEFMVQCETCKVWQHGLCMGYQSEDQVHDDDYYCEQCRPELHVELLKRLAKRPRQASAASRQDPANSRVSRSHSPTHLHKQPSKRRNTMNSRDAAFDESLKEIIEATAAEAAAVHDAFLVNPNEIEPIEVVSGGKKKRKRTDDDSISKKRTRSASTASDGQSGTAPPGEIAVVDKVPPQSSKPPGRNKRGGRKTAAVDTAPMESEEVVPMSTKRQGNNSRAKATNAVKRPPLCQSTSNGSTGGIHEHGTRRNQAAGSGGQPAGSGTAESSRAYRNSHAYAVSQQSFFTSWNLPDYLSHLEQMLPTDTPQPLEVCAGISSTGAPSSRGDGSERTLERGVKVKWPSKRMSVGDMNKRVRALVEWVGREQAGALDRGRRREALEKALRQQPANALDGVSPTGESDMEMVIDEDEATTADQQNKETNLSFAAQATSECALEMTTLTMKMMEELMEELIGFQERFGPGAKHREKRLVV